MKFILTFIILFTIKSSSANILENINEIIEFTEFVGEQLGIFSDDEPDQTKLASDKQVDDVLDAIADVADKMEAMAESIDMNLDGITSQISSMEHMQKIMKAQDELSEYIVRIDELYEEFLSYSDEADGFERETIEEFIDVITGHDNFALGNTLNRMHALFVPKRTQNIKGSILNFVLGLEEIESEFSCNNAISIQQYILELYNIVIISELKGYLIIDFAFSTLAAYEKKSYAKEQNKSTGQLLLRAMEYLNSTKSALSNASRKYVRCNPQHWEEESNFFEMKRLYQGFVIGEDQTKKPCGQVDETKFDSCHKYQVSKLNDDFYDMHTKWTDQQFCMNQKCRGQVSHCLSIGVPTVCEMKDGDRLRYLYVKNDKDETWGAQNNNCANGTEKTIPVGSKDGHKDNFCLCECSEINANSKSLRSFSIMPVESNIKDNMVVTGIRITNKNNIIHLEIEQGKLLDSGNIDDNTVEWQPSPNFVYKEEGYFGKWDVVHTNGTKREMVFKYDFMTFWTEQRKLNLDDIYAPKDYVITGVRFSPDESELKIEKRWPRMPLQLSIQITPFNYSNGKLIPTNEKPSKWIKPEDVENKGPDYSRKRSEVNIKNSLYPLATPRPQVRDSTLNQFIKFQMTDLKKDVGAYTIPFFEKQDVSPVKKAALDGIGIFHKGVSGFGGFIALQVFHIDYFKYMEAAVSPDKLKSFSSKTASSVPSEKKLKTNNIRKRTKG